MYPEILYKLQINEDAFKDKYPELYGFYRAVNTNDMNSSKQIDILINTPDELSHAICSWQKNIINLGILDIQEKNQKFRIFSIFPLIGILEDIIENPQFIEMFFTQYKEIPNYNVYSEQNIIPQNEDDISDDRIEGTKHFDSINPFIDILLKWVHSYSNNQFKSSPLLCSRIMKRFFMSLRNINSEISNKEIFIGMYIHRCLVAIFNSILIEEFLLNIKNKEFSINLANAITDDKIFINNLSKIYNLATHLKVDNIMDFFHDRLPLFTFVFTCPLWGLYLKNRDENGKEILNEAYAEYMKLQEGSKADIQESYKVILIYGDNQKEFSNLYYPLNSLVIQKK